MSHQSLLLENDPLFDASIKEVILVDDVVTQGRTAFACCQKIATKFPGIPVKLFALIRTVSFENLTDWNAPSTTEIVYYPPSGKTRHLIHPDDSLGGLWG